MFNLLSMQILTNPYVASHSCSQALSRADCLVNHVVGQGGRGLSVDPEPFAAILTASEPAVAKLVARLFRTSRLKGS